jgi:hypothetical protein
MEKYSLYYHILHIDELIRSRFLQEYLSLTVSNFEQENSSSILQGRFDEVLSRLKCITI